MEKNKVLYEIKTLEKLIARYLLNINDCCFEVQGSPPTPTQMQIIDYILNHPNEDIHQRDLENVLNLRRATVSGVLQTMEKNLLIERVHFAGDARAKKIILNENAKKMFLECEEQISRLGALVTYGINDSDLKTFCSVINKMKENITKA